MAFEPVNQAGILGQAMGLAGDYRGDQQRQALLSLQQDELRQRQQVFQAQQAEAAQKVQQQQAYEAAVGEFIKNPSAQAAAELQMRFPEQREAIKGGWDTKEKAAQDGDLRELAAIFGYLNAGATDKAKAAIQRRIEADKAAGQDTSDDEAVLALIDENPEQAKGVTAHLLASVGGSDKYAAILEQTRLGGKDQAGFTLGQGQTRFDAEGNPIASVAPETEYLVIPEGGKAVPKGSLAGGGGQASGGAGGGAPRSVRNNNPGNLRDSAFTRKLPGYQGADSGGFAIFASPEAGAQAQGSLLKSYMDRGYNTVSKIISRWAPPSDGNDTGGYVKMVASELGVKPGDVLTAGHIPALQQAITRVEGGPSSASNGPGGGDPAGTLYGDPKPKTRVLSREEVAAIPGLDPNTAYQQSPEGTITAIGGQNKSQLKAWPATALGARASNDAALTNIDGAIRLIDPKNTSKEAQTARNAIGFGTGMLGDRFTQWNDPEGTDARARIGQIGGLIIKDTSGAAVSLAEDQRLAKWVPLVTDDAKVALAKLKNLQRELRQRNAAMDDTYSEDQGYRPFKNNSGGPPQGAIDLLRSNPRLAPQFDAKYGAGMARKVLGK